MFSLLSVIYSGFISLKGSYFIALGNALSLIHIFIVSQPPRQAAACHPSTEGNYWGASPGILFEGDNLDEGNFPVVKGHNVNEGNSPLWRGGRPQSDGVVVVELAHIFCVVDESAELIRFNRWTSDQRLATSILPLAIVASPKKAPSYRPVFDTIVTIQFLDGRCV